MRLRHVVLAAVVGSLMVGGCARQEPAADVAETRESFVRLTPDVQVGVVSAVLPENALLAISDVDVTKHFVGETFVLMTPAQKIIGAGHVVAKTEKALHVKYDVNEDGRAPRVGDIAVKPTM